MTKNTTHEVADALLTIRGTYGCHIAAHGSAWCAFRKCLTDGIILGIRPTMSEDNSQVEYDAFTRIVVDGPAGVMHLGTADSIGEAVAMLEERLPMLVAEALAKNILHAALKTPSCQLLADVILDGMPVKNVAGKAGGGRIRQGIAWALPFIYNGRTQEVVLTTSTVGNGITVSSRNTPWDADVQGDRSESTTSRQGGIVRADDMESAAIALAVVMGYECTAEDMRVSVETEVASWAY